MKVPIVLAGQALGLRRPPRPPCTRPCVLFRLYGKTGSDGIVFDVPLYPPEFLVIAHQAIVTLILPKGLTRSPKQQVSSLCAGSFQRSQELRHAHLRGEEQMDVIGHDDPSVQVAVSYSSAVFDRGKGLLSDGRLSEEGGPAAGLIKQTVHSGKGFAGGRMRRQEDAMRESPYCTGHVKILAWRGGLGGRRWPRACPTKRLPAESR